MSFQNDVSQQILLFATLQIYSREIISISEISFYKAKSVQLLQR